MFDKDRLTWINGKLIREMPLETLLKRAERFWPESAAQAPTDYQIAVLKLVQERLKFLSELPELTDFFFTDPQVDPKLLDESMKPLLKAAIPVLEGSDFSETDLEAKLRGLAEEQGIKPGTLFSALRVAVTGKKAAPGIFETLHVLGREVTLKRLSHAVAILNR
jgi:glutamyl/glutaminyl-tRNA synthetase